MENVLFMQEPSLFRSLIHGDGEAVRNFVHAADIANAFDLILHEGQPGATYNIGTESQISMIDLAKDLVKRVSATLCTRQGTHGTGKTGKMTQKIPCQGKHREFGHFAKTQGIFFGQVVNSLILNVKDIAIFAAKISIFSLTLDRYGKSVLCV